MNILVVFAHPNPESFNGTVCQRVCTQLTEQGHQIDLLDLYQNGFEPCMSRAERLIYMERDKNIETVEAYVKQLQWADALVLVYPTWWMGPPAILKGWFDRVWLPHVVAEFSKGKVQPKLTNIKKIMVITTQGASKWRMRLAMNPPKLMLKASLKACTCCKGITWLALYSMDKATDSKRKEFLITIKNKIARCF